MSTIPNEPAAFEVDNTEDWNITIVDSDLNGNPIPHTSDVLFTEIKDADGNIVFTPTLALVPGTTNAIQLIVPWSTVHTLPSAEYFASVVTVVSATSRVKIVDIVIRHDVK